MEEDISKKMYENLVVLLIFVDLASSKKILEIP